MLYKLVLLFVILSPLIGALWVAFFLKEEETGARNIRNVGVWVSFVSFILTILLLFHFDKTATGFQFVSEYKWFLGFFDTHLKFGIDGISLLFIILTTLLTPVAILLSTTDKTVNIKPLIITVLLMESAMIGLFSALDLVLFYVFFETLLIPVFILIGMWGGANRVSAGFRFFLYTFLGSLFLLVAIIYIVYTTGTSDYEKLVSGGYFINNIKVQKILWLCFFIAFAVKLPLIPVHIWQPQAYSQSPTLATVLLAGALKMGGYGFIRFLLPLFPQASYELSFIPLILGVVSIIYASLIALKKTDIKEIIVYGAIAHMGVVAVGVFSLNKLALEGAVLTLISQGFVTGIIFLLLGKIYEKLGTYDLKAVSGVVNIMPHYAAVILVFVLASIGLPGTAPFIGELFVILGSALNNVYIAVFTAVTVILSAGYMLSLYKNAILGGITNTSISVFSKLEGQEKIIYLLMCLLVILFGIFPNLILSYIHTSINEIIDNNYITLTKLG